MNKENLLQYICNKMGVYPNKEWVSNYNDILKITLDGKIVFWNNIEKNWVNYSECWANILTGEIYPKEEINNGSNR